MDIENDCDEFRREAGDRWIELFSGSANGGLISLKLPLQLVARYIALCLYVGTGP